jgi:hypothetical protein
MTELLFLRWRDLRPAERWVLVALLVAVAGAWLAPAVRQDPAYHRFADQRLWLGIANAANVLSNAAFLAVGLYGAARLASTCDRALSPATRAGLWCVAAGFCFTAAGSAWYHIQPADATLVWDRLPMTLIFTGLLGVAIAQRFGENIARACLAVVLELGVASVVYWHVTGNLTPYLLLQYGGLAALLLVVLLTRRGGDPFPWWWVIGLYALAKGCEVADASIWRATGGVVAGHALKHLVAAMAGLAAFRPLKHVRPAAGDGDRNVTSALRGR